MSYKRPSKLRRQQNVSSACVVTSFTNGVPTASTTLPYTSRVDFDKRMEWRASHFANRLGAKPR